MEFMRLFVLALTMALSLAVVSVASAGGGNSANVKACQKGKWMKLVRSDGSAFTSQDACVSYAAHGGTLVPKPTCTEDFSEDAVGSLPTTFTGGSIDTAYGSFGGVKGPSPGWSGNVLFSGDEVNSFQLTFTDVVPSVQLDVGSNGWDHDTHVTLTGYDASNAVVGTDSVTQPAYAPSVHLSVASASTNIKYFAIATDDPYQMGLL
ncbi:MAG: hypothetical protein ACJ74D_04315, partial [Gaiellaceae bacterium]